MGAKGNCLGGYFDLVGFGGLLGGASLSKVITQVREERH